VEEDVADVDGLAAIWAGNRVIVYLGFHNSDIKV